MLSVILETIWIPCIPFWMAVMSFFGFAGYGLASLFIYDIATWAWFLNSLGSIATSGISVVLAIRFYFGYYFEKMRTWF